MNYTTFFILLIIVLSCKAQKVVVEENTSPLLGKILDENFVALQNVEISSNDYILQVFTDENGNFKISNKSFLNDFNDGYDILISLKKSSYETKNIVLNKSTHLNGNNRLKFLSLKTVPQKHTSKPKQNMEKVEAVKIEVPEKDNNNSNKEITTKINVEKVSNENGTVNFGNVTYDQSSTVNEGDNTTIYNETKIIKDTKIIEIPFEERDCAQKEIGYLLIKNNYNEGINIKITTYGEKKGPFAMRFENYTLGKNASKILRLTSNYYYDLNGEKFSEKWAGTYVYGFSDGFFINPCDTVSVVTP